MRLTSLLLLALLAGCAATPPSSPDGDTPWEQHRAQLAALDAWQAQGKLALRNGSESETANLLWRQRGATSELQLSGPLGMAATHILAEGERLEVRRGEELLVLDISTPRAVELSTGWDLPLKALPYWMLGIPEPGSKRGELQFTNQRLSTIRTDGWQVSFDGYGQFDAFTLPTRMRLSRGDTSAKLIIRDWQPGTAP